MGTALFIGIFLGSVISGFVSDRFGRRKTLIFATFAQFVVGVASAFTTNLLAFIAVRGLFGLLIGFTIPIGPTMVSELTPTKFRGRGIVIINFFFTVGKIYCVIVAKIFLDTIDTGNWRAMIIVCTLPSLIVCYGTWRHLKESPRFLIGINKIDEGIVNFDHVGKMNNGDSYAPISAAEKEALVDWQKHTFKIQDVSNFKSIW